MNNKWNRNNALWILLYAVLYAVATAVVCVTGSIHPIFFVCYQITAGLLLSPIIIRAFRRVQAPGAAVCLFMGILLLLLIIRDAVMWHVVPLIVISVLAEIVRAMAKYSRIWRYTDVSQPCMGISCGGCSRYFRVGIDYKRIHEEAHRY